MNSGFFSLGISMNEDSSALIFDQIGIPPLLVLLLPFFATMVGTPIFRDIALKYGIVDAPVSGDHKTHREPTPYLGGVALYISFMIGIYVVMHQAARTIENFNVYAVMSAFTIIFIVGLWDDLRGMKPGIKMLMLAVSGSILFAGGARISFIPESWGVIGTGISYILTLFWILGITNSANLMDNMNGLASGTAIVAGVSLMSIAVIGSDAVGIGLSMTLIGGLLGYFFYNFPSGKIFFGDAGSMVLGFYLSFLGLMSGRYPHGENLSAVSHVLAPIVVMGVFVFDTFFVAISRGKRKINFWWGGKDHTSHRLVNYGFSKIFAVAIIWLLGVVFGGVAIVVKMSPGWMGTILSIFVLIAGIWFWGKLEKIPIEKVEISATAVRANQIKLRRSGDIEK